MTQFEPSATPVSQLASQRSFHNPGPAVCSPPLASHRGPEVRSQKILHKIWLWDHSDSCATFSGTYSGTYYLVFVTLNIASSMMKMKCLGVVNPCLFCTSLISMGEFEFEGQLNTLSILRHPVVRVQGACIIFKAVNGMLI